MTKLKKKTTYINFSQEIPLLKAEHEKLKKIGLKNTLYSSHSDNWKVGVAMLMSNLIKFDCQKEINDK